MLALGAGAQKQMLGGEYLREIDLQIAKEADQEQVQTQADECSCPRRQHLLRPLSFAPLPRL